jgi:hypothetical protein
MNIRGSRLTVGFGFMAAVLLVLYAILVWDYAILKIRVKFADEQIHIFDDLKKEAISGGPQTAASRLGGILNYYPSGSKQITGSELDRMVERERAHAVQEIIAYLRAKTGQDLGEKPEPWIQKYGHGN